MNSAARLRTVLLIVAAAMLLLPGRAHPAPRVLIVHSYEQGHVCGQPRHGIDIPSDILMAADEVVGATP
jgi:hypothetical protein